MSIAFELTPEGQAWNDYNAKPLDSDDLSTPFFAGTATALPRGFIKGAMGLPETVASGYEKLTHDYEPVSDEEFYSFSYALKNSANRLFGGFIGKAEEAKEIIKPDTFAQGTAAQVVQGVGEFVPSIVAAAATGPLGGGVHAFSTTYESVNQDMLKQGVDDVTARHLALQQSGFNAVGMALPAGIGGSLATRVGSGAGINIGFGMGSRYASGAILESSGYKDMASQYKVWDTQALLIDGILGAAFGYTYHLGAPKKANKALNIPEFLQSKNLVDNDVSVNHSNIIDTELPQLNDRNLNYVYAIAERKAINEVINNSVSDLEIKSTKRLPDKKSIEKELYEINYKLSEQNLERYYNDLVNSFRSNKVSGRSAKGKAKKDLEKYKADLLLQKEDLQSKLDTHKEANQARNDLSVIKKNRIPDRLKKDIEIRRDQIADEIFRNPDLLAEINSHLENIKPSDIDAAQVLNEGRYYDFESSPVLHGTPKSLNAHNAAMEKAARQLMDGEAVYVHDEIQTLEGVFDPEASYLGKAYQVDMERVFKNNNIDYSDRMIAVEAIPEVNNNSAFSKIENTDISKDLETGEILSSNNFDLIKARDIASKSPDLTVPHPDTGEMVTLDQALIYLDEQITTAKNEAHVYDVAASCFLRNS